MSDEPAPVKAAVRRSFVASIRAAGFQPIEHVGRVFKYAWSIRLIIAAAALSGCEVALPIIDEWIEIPRGIFAALSAFTSCGAFIARFVVQARVTVPSPPEEKDEHDASQ